MTTPTAITETALCWGCDAFVPISALRAVRVDEELTVTVCRDCKAKLGHLVVLPTEG